MARCQRCNGCRSMWDTRCCPWCNYPDTDIRGILTRVSDFCDKYDMHISLTLGAWTLAGIAVALVCYVRW